MKAPVRCCVASIRKFTHAAGSLRKQPKAAECDRSNWLGLPVIFMFTHGRDKYGHNPYHGWYNTRMWRRLREMVLHRDPICKKCNRRASTVADHIKDHKGNWALFTALWNLQGLCKPCHDEKTATTSHPGNTPEDKKPKATAVGDAALDAALKAYENADAASACKRA